MAVIRNDKKFFLMTDLGLRLDLSGQKQSYATGPQFMA